MIRFHLLPQMYLTWRLVSLVACRGELNLTDLVEKNKSPVYSLDHDRVDPGGENYRQAETRSPEASHWQLDGC